MICCLKKPPPAAPSAQPPLLQEGILRFTPSWTALNFRFVISNFRIKVTFSLFHGNPVMTTLLADLRYALRILRRSPLFTTVAILSLALGIGANTAIFTLMDQIVLRKLPIKNPENLVMLYQTGANNGSNMGLRMHSYPMYQDFQEKAAPFSEVICRRLISTSLTVDNQTEKVEAEMVSGNFFSMLGVPAALGRVFSSEEDDRVYQGHPVVVLSYPYWVRRFASDPGVIGKKILVNN